jgi:hypothetical protein
VGRNKHHVRGLDAAHVGGPAVGGCRRLPRGRVINREQTLAASITGTILRIDGGMTSLRI